MQCHGSEHSRIVPLLTDAHLNHYIQTLQAASSHSVCHQQQARSVQRRALNFKNLQVFEENKRASNQLVSKQLRMKTLIECEKRKGNKHGRIVATLGYLS